MAYPSVTYTFANGAGNLIDATEVNQNFTDIINGISDGTKDIQVAKVVAKGDVDLGDAISDTITATGRFDSDIVPSTDNARDLGTSALTFAELHTKYFSMTSTKGTFGKYITVPYLDITREDDEHTEAETIDNYSLGITFMATNNTVSNWALAVAKAGAHNGSFVVTFNGKDGFAGEYVGFQIYCPFMAATGHLLIRWCNDTNQTWSSWYDIADI